jgi:hypothetical protein
MMRVRGWGWGAVIAGVALVGAAGRGGLAQQRGDRAPAASVGDELRGLASRAGVVFVGQVAKIEPQGGVVQITFTVQQPVLGVAGGSYVMREWAGRWTGGQQRYWVGERAMFFLHAPGGTAGGGASGGVGLSSPVEGMMGVVPVVPMGANGGALLDVRWLAARVGRRLGAPMVGASTGAIALADAVAVTKSWETNSVAEPKSVRLPEGMLVQPHEEMPVQSGVLRPGRAAEAARVSGWVQQKEAGDAQR